MVVTGKIILKSGRDASLKRFHPWVFSGGVQKKEGRTEDGDWVEVTDSRGEPLGFGHYQNGSIAVRVLHMGREIPTDDFYARKIKIAFNLRQHAGVISERTNSYRLVHGEGDGLPALIVDVYNRVAVMQSHSEGIHRDRQMIAQAIAESIAVDSVFYKSQSGQQAEYLFGSAVTPVEILEHGKKFLVD